MSLEAHPLQDEQLTVSRLPIVPIGPVSMHKFTKDQPAVIPTDTIWPAVVQPGVVLGKTLERRRSEHPPCWQEAIGTFRVAADGRGEWLGCRPEPANFARNSQRLKPLAMLDSVLDSAQTHLPGNGWAGYLSFELVGSIEPLAGVRAGQPGVPLAELHRVDLGANPEGGRDTHPTNARRTRAQPGSTRPVLRSVQGEAAYTAAVARALAYIRAGDIYQANIAHQFTGRFTGSATDLYATLTQTAQPQHGMCLIAAPLTDGSYLAVLSLSPELFLSFDAQTRRLTTRPMKGTRPGHADPTELRDATKDRAELAMIVDLMRNDLGRVCEFGSIEVECERTIEHHGSGPGSVLQATATISGTVREGLSTADILAATFPPGSVTGTPKIRAMQIIHELEPFTRGPYCGCLGTFTDDGTFELAVAIRTAVIHGRTDPATGDFLDAEFSYCVGAGIVADSDPEAEWQETLDKARVLEVAFDLNL